jgi:hypothetical protein
MYSTSEEQCGHTGNHIAGIHSILVFDESEAIHELDLGDLSCAMSVEMGLDISLGGCGRSVIFFDGAPAKLGGSGEDYAPDYAHHFEEDCPGITW